MILPSINPSSTIAWKQLLEHFSQMENVEMKDMFSNDAKRTDKFHVKWDNFLLDYSKNRINEETVQLLIELANQVGLKESISNYFEGKNINDTENRAALHVALRAKDNEIYNVNGNNVVPEVYKVKKQIKNFTSQVLEGEIKGFSGKLFTDIINIGIGGSDLGPAMVVEALKFYKNELNSHFVSNADVDYIQEILKKLNPETTLVVIVSKTFTTKETITNAKIIKNWILNEAKDADISNHFAAVTADTKKALDFGVQTNATFPIWDWVGGRFSIWSAVGLTISLNIGFANFEKLLLGANKMDIHFKETPFEKNIPVLLALIGIWYNNFFKTETEAIIPYSQYLQKFAPYLQQGVMESNGKNIDRNGKEVNYQTSPIIWGEPGTNAQHAFFQLFHQGTKLIPTDFIGFKESLYDNKIRHNEFMANFFAQSEALLMGKTLECVQSEMQHPNMTSQEAEKIAPFKVFKGNKPSNSILIDKLTPESLGSLIAVYEHKIFTQGIVWNIFSYDQWGVELGKKLASSILEELNLEKPQIHDASTTFLINAFKEK
jgi:glucose-6-phosphate isomerase